jgi:hypothetical protein
MENKRINPILWIGLIGTLTIGTSFIADAYRAFWGDQSIWWTPLAMTLPVEETRDNFELYIGGKPLRKHLSDGTLFSVDNNGKQYSIVSKDITVRLNNWDKIKASILGHTTMSGFAFGVAITLLVIGLIQIFHHGKKSR